MQEKISAIPESDWLIEDFTSNQAKDALILSMTALIQIATQCCNPPLDIDELQELLETVYYEMD